MHASNEPSTELTIVCNLLKDTLNAHEIELESATSAGQKGPWGLVKSAVQVFLPGLVNDEISSVDHQPVAKIHQNIRKVKHHMEAVCENGNGLKRDYLDPVDALISLLPRISPESNEKPNVSPRDFNSTPNQSFAPKLAPAEPPTQTISGPGLAKAGVVNDVPSRLMYTQTSEGDPRLVWKLEVEMRENWYEAYVDAQSGDLLRVVDWAHDYSWGTAAGDKGELKGHKQKPLPAPPTEIKPYTYQIFPWGE